ncbi:hypothetical protein XENTR_v10018620 [Xenopus tropicalis]|nr:hypothetical protein XENTR_v10018620 [Xenopus tropicalis]
MESWWRGKQLVQYTGNPLLSLFVDMPESSYGEGSSDPAHLLNVIDDTMIPVSSEEQIVTKEADLAIEDYHGSHVLSPIFGLTLLVS